MKATLFAGVSGILFLVLLAPAATQEKPPPKKLPPFIMEMLKKTPEEFLKQFDKNADGFLQKEEVPPFLAKNFEKFDRNNDGKLDLAETGQMLQTTRQFLAAQLPPMRQADFDALDKNADGRLTKEELKDTPWLAKFADIDTNGDGRLDRREWEAYLLKSVEKK